MSNHKETSEKHERTNLKLKELQRNLAESKENYNNQKMKLEQFAIQINQLKSHNKYIAKPTPITFKKLNSQPRNHNIHDRK